MRSHALTEPVVTADRARTRELLVLWRHPETGQIIPIGRLARDRGLYTFDYTVAAAQIEGFRTLPGLGRIGDHFESPDLPTLFLQRVMDRERPDFAEYVASLGLSPETATPWEQIVESGGERAGDTLQFMELPAVVDGNALTRFLANGVRHIPGRQAVINGVGVTVGHGAHERALMALAPDDLVEIVAEDDNDVDENATLVTSHGTPLGWVPRFLAPSVRQLLASGQVLVRVIRVNGPDSPSHLRLVLELDSPAPAGFAFDPVGAWEPVSTRVD